MHDHLDGATVDDNEFLNYIHRYAASLKGAPISSAEAQRIIAEFNALDGEAYERARKAVRTALGLNQLVEELRKSANLDNTRRLLLDLQNAAKQWQATKK
jgi:hypothetical protein